MRRSWLIALGLVPLALTACGGGGANPEPTRTAPPTRASVVLVATHLIRKGTPGEVIAGKGLYQLARIPKSQVATHALVDPSALAGEVALTDVSPGQQLSADYFGTAPPADTLPGAGTTAATAPAKSGPALLAKIRIGHHQGYDRIVFQFANALPGYRVSYVRPPFHQDGSGRPVKVHGRAFAFVRLEPASGYDMANNKPVYRGPSRIAGAAHGTSVIREAVRTGDFESVLGWVVGLEKQVPFRVVGLKGPPRLVIDFRNR